MEDGRSQLFWHHELDQLLEPISAALGGEKARA
jgi:hypothetical protein